MADFEELGNQLLYEAPLDRWSDLEGSLSLPPRSPGVYSWFFRRLPAPVPTTGCVMRDGAVLLYVGISPKNPKSRQTLRSRIRYHFRGNAEGSTLRLTLGCLLEAKLGTVLRRVGSGKRKTFGEAERKLTAWMAENAWLAGSKRRIRSRSKSTLSGPWCCRSTWTKMTTAPSTPNCLNCEAGRGNGRWPCPSWGRVTEELLKGDRWPLVPQPLRCTGAIKPLKL